MKVNSQSVTAVTGVTDGVIMLSPQSASKNRDAYFYQLVPKRGFEPRQGNPYWTLNPARLPVPPLRLAAGENLKRFSLAISDC
jgi:hypothetical protein